MLPIYLITSAFTHHPSHLQVWQDEQRARMGDVRHLALWRPVAPAGYVALGMVAGLGSLPPPVSVMRCVRVDAALSTTLQVWESVWWKSVGLLVLTWA